MSKLTLDFMDKQTIEDLASFCGMEFEQCKTRLMNFNDKEIADQWNKCNPKTHKELLSFYADTDLYIFDLTQANCSRERKNFHGRIVDYLLTNYPVSDYRKVLDYGSGVGEEVVKFAEKGYSVSYADVIGKTSEFVKHRLMTRGLEATFIPIQERIPFLKTQYDIIIIFDVLEHILQPVRVLNFLTRHLSKDGVIAIVNCPYDDGDHPCHLPSTFSVLGKNWPQTLDNVRLIPLLNFDNIYKKAKLSKRLICKARFLFWKLTSLYVIRIPKK